MDIEPPTLLLLPWGSEAEAKAVLTVPEAGIIDGLDSIADPLMVETGEVDMTVS